MPLINQFKSFKEIFSRSFAVRSFFENKVKVTINAKGLFQRSFERIINFFFTSHLIIIFQQSDGMRLDARVKGLNALCEGIGCFGP